jgi:tetratricopeptide (TPR) repeat protein
MTLAVLSVLVVLAQSVAASDLPKPPDWGDDFNETPEWWTSVADEYRFSESTNFWRVILDAERKIKNDVGRGLSVTVERRQLIKYATHILQTTELKEDDAGQLEGEIALTYGYLGDYRRSILAYNRLLNNRPVQNYGPCLLGLAMNYERIGDKDGAIEVYKLLDKEYENDKYFPEYSTVGRIGIACLTGVKMGCIPPKPVWWGQFQGPPEWLTNMQMTIPPVTCFRDGLDYIAVTMAKEHDSRRKIKAWEELSYSVPLSYQDKTLICIAIASKYSDIADYHRSIIYAWRVLDEYPSDAQMCTSALEWIRRDFEKLGDTNEVAEIRKSLECYSKSPK